METKIVIVEETLKTRKIICRLLKPEDGVIKIPNMNLSASHPRYIVWVEDASGNLAGGHVPPFGYSCFYKVFESRAEARECFKKTVKYYRWQETLETEAPAKVYDFFDPSERVWTGSGSRYGINFPCSPHSHLVEDGKCFG